MSTRAVLIVAGEPSGDMHAALVVEELRKLSPGIRFYGLGLGRLKAVGVEVDPRATELAVMGFSSIPRVLPKLFQVRRSLLARVRSGPMPLVILVDYPGFNLNLAAAIKRLSNPPKILYYIAPQVWAWRPGRLTRMRRLIDHIAVVLPFELELFQTAGIPTTFVGHPLLDELGDKAKGEYIRPVGSPPLVALLPGSRRHLIDRHLQAMLGAVELIHHRLGEVRAVVGRADNLEAELFSPYLHGRDWLTVTNDTADLLTRADAAIVSSGTATLQTALQGVPQVVIYRTSGLNYLLARQLVKVPFISLVNLTAGRQVVPELIQHQASARSIADTLLPLLTDQSARERIGKGYDEVREMLGEGGAAQAVARIAAGLL